MGVNGKVLVVLLVVALLGVGGALVVSAAPKQAPSGHEVVAGVVTKVAGSEITIRSRSGEVIIVVGGDAWIFVGGKEASLDAIKVEMRLTAAGDRDAAGKLTAKFVMAAPGPTARGQMPASRFAVAEVVSLSGDTLKVKTVRNGEQQVTLTNQTVIEQLQGKDAPRSDLVPGTKVIIRGQRTAAGTFEARRIIILPKDFTPGRNLKQWSRPDAPGSAPKGSTPRPSFPFGPGHPGGPGGRWFNRPGA